MRSTPLRKYEELDRKNMALASTVQGPSKSSSGSGIAAAASIASQLSSSQQTSQTLYMPIASPPTPAPSPGPYSSFHTHQPHIPSRNPSSPANPLLRRQFLIDVLNSCTPSELLFISTTIAPLLKRDFLSSLPVELAIHILGFIDDPKTLVRGAQVSRYWCSLVRDECVWKRMCVFFGFDDDWGGEKRGNDMTTKGAKRNHENDTLSAPLVSYADPAASSSIQDEGQWQTAGRAGKSRTQKGKRPVVNKLPLPRTQEGEEEREEDEQGEKEEFSYLSHFKVSYITHQNWRHGGHLLASHRIPVSSPDSGVITSVALDSSYIVVGLANSKIQVFSAKTGVMVRTLVGHELGVWGVCLISRGGWMWGRNEDDDDGKKGKGKKKEADDKGPKPFPRTGNAPMRGLRAGMAGMDVRDGLDHLLSPGMRYALGLDASSDGSSGTSGGVETEDDDGVFDEDEADEDEYGSHRRAGGHQEARESLHHHHHQRASSDLHHENNTSPQTHPTEKENSHVDGRETGNAQENETPSNMCYSSIGWGQPSSIVVSGGCDKVLRVWDVESGQCIYILQGHTSTIRCIRVLHNRPIAISGSRDATLRVWDVQKGKCLRVLEGHHQSVRCLDVCGRRVVSGSYDNTCRVWDVDTGECIHVLEGHFHQIYSVAFDGVRIASGGLDTTVRVWDAATGECLALLQGHTALVCQLQLASFTPPSSPSSPPIPILATGGSDGRVITFSLATYTILHRIAAHDSSVTSLQFDKRWLVTGGNDGRVRLFETETGNYVRDLSEPGESVWKVVFGRDVCAVMCKRAGKSVTEIWSLRGLLGRGGW